MSGALRPIAGVDVAGKTVLIRADVNVPMKDGRVTDATRLERFAPTVADLADRGAKVVILSHLGRPNGEVNRAFSLRPVADALAEILKRPVRFADDCVGPEAETVAGELKDGQIAVFENVRFHPGEEANDRNFALRLSVVGDLYVNDAFSCAHRAHASTYQLATILPAYAGPSLMAEVGALEAALTTPKRPVAALVGGAKVSSKIGVLEFLVPKMDHLVIGGGMANTFLAAQGHDVGKSLYEPDALETAKKVMGMAEEAGCQLHLPVDLVVAREFKANAANETVGVDAIPADAMALDVGPKTIAAITAALETCRTLLWNGPLGAFEITPFDAATNAVALAAARLTKAGTLVTVAGGGDTVAALNASGAADDFTYLSTAGGAFLEWLEGRELPGIEILKAPPAAPEQRAS
ncbi:MULTISPECIES: phosphoglycerate kinase [unclassified Aureimonas]|uniref:phosphoglycerate kinase n=1 Tax=unclassified Aureimonas TaxID=2615206 RepID=UPI0007016E72|nr:MULTISPECIES: phosphoglycerate kinase [unclassified Aureimonas]KQT69686.1 phosphoglycerate kinase [Aureimonas sp. Leaf427]KQT76161.1 phosphoglycerate kinase [Aureimonas sp. Leaf460]